MLRRVKTDVELDIPPKKELLVFTPLTPAQDELYRALLSKNIHQLLAPKVKITNLSRHLGYKFPLFKDRSLKSG